MKYIHPFVLSLIQKFINSFHFLTAGPQPIPKPVLHRWQASSSSFKLQCPVFSLKVIYQLLTSSISSCKYDLTFWRRIFFFKF